MMNLRVFTLKSNIYLVDPDPRYKIHTRLQILRPDPDGMKQILTFLRVVAPLDLGEPR